jgi:hypothetical protein
LRPDPDDERQITGVHGFPNYSGGRADSRVKRRDDGTTFTDEGTVAPAGPAAAPMVADSNPVTHPALFTDFFQSRGALILDGNNAVAGWTLV